MKLYVLYSNREPTLSDPSEVFSSPEKLVEILFIQKGQPITRAAKYIAEIDYSGSEFKEGGILQGTFTVDGTKLIQVEQLIAKLFTLKAERNNKYINEESRTNFFKEEKSLDQAAKLLQFMELPSFSLKESIHTFIKQLAEILPPSFYDLNPKGRLEKILELRNNSSFMNIMLKHWQMACHFLDKISAKDEEARIIIRQTRFQKLYILNELRRELLPVELRKVMPTKLQQDIILAVLMRKKSHKTIKVPTLKEGAVTQVLHDMDLNSDLTLPEDLVCPLSGRLFVDPVKVIEITEKGEHEFIFEKDYILQYLQQKKENPLTRRPLTEGMLKPAADVKAKVDNFKKMMMEQTAVQIKVLAKDSKAEIQNDEQPKSKFSSPSNKN